MKDKIPVSKIVDKRNLIIDPALESKKSFMFGAKRKNRIHAGYDFYLPKQTEIFLPFTCTVARVPYLFYKGTKAIDLFSKDLNIILRFCEMEFASQYELKQHLEVGNVPLGVVGDMGFKTTPNMLHLEIYCYNELLEVGYEFGDSFVNYASNDYKRIIKPKNPMDYFTFDE